MVHHFVSRGHLIGLYSHNNHLKRQTNSQIDNMIYNKMVGFSYIICHFTVAIDTHLSTIFPTNKIISLKWAWRNYK